MKVVCSLREIRDALGMNDSDLQRELNLDRRTIGKLISDDGWRLDKSQLHRLILFAHSHGYRAFKLVPHQLWAPFGGSSEQIAIFRGSSRSDAPIEEYLSHYIELLDSHNTYSTTSNTDVRKSMLEQNCVFIGSPKANPASETALALLFGAEPFDSSAENRDRIPIHFTGMLPDHESKASALLTGGASHGFHIQMPGSTSRIHHGVDWLPHDKYGPRRGTLKEAAVLAVCYRPLGTQKSVATIVVAGYTGLSTQFAAEQISYGSLPAFAPLETPGVTWFATLEFSYDKPRDYPRPNEISRLVDEKTIKWTGPWKWEPSSS